MSAAAFLRAAALGSAFAAPPSSASFEAAFRLAVGLRFGADAPLLAISGTVRAVARRHPDAMLPVREAEMLIRDALGETVPVGDISPADTVKVHVLVFAELVRELALTDAELDELLAQASLRP